MREVRTVFMSYLFHFLVEFNFRRLRTVLGLQNNRERYRDFSYTRLNTYISLSITNITHQNGRFFTMTHQNQQNFIVYLKIYFWCCVFYGSEQKYKDIYPSLKYHTKYFHCSKNALCSAYSSLHSPALTAPGKPLIFLLSPRLCYQGDRSQGAASPRFLSC